jgi:hypothetical protein
MKDREYTFKDLIKAYEGNLKIGDRLNELRVKEALKTFFGDFLMKRVTYIAVRGSELHIKVDSAPLRSELSMGKEKIIDFVNTACKRDVINTIRLL